MSYTQHKDSARSLRDRARERFSHIEDESTRAFRGAGEPANGVVREGAGLGAALEKAASYWWVELALGVFWIVVSLVVLKFNQASVTTVGILTGLMFLLFAAQESVLAVVDRPRRWLWAIFSVLLAASGIVALIHPTATFAGFADILGFVFVLIGVMWMVQAFTERPVNDLWWLTLISGIMMTVLAFWVSGQFFVVRAYTLLIFAGVWAMTTGIIDIVRAFQIREIGRGLGGHSHR
jgi:uncharacterized membrane protein HdeD (DUF308 family)